MTGADIAVVVPVHNRRALATPCFNALAREATEARIDVIVVDQQSTDGIAQVARDLGFTVISSEARTAGGLRNAGVECTKSKWVCFIDSDVLIPRGYFDRLRAALIDHPRALIGCNYGLPEHPHWTERTWDMMTVQRGDGDRVWINAGNMAVERALFLSVGRFDERLTSGEDTELCRRVLEKGMRVLQLQSLDAAHLGNPKSVRAFLAKQIWHGQGSKLTDRNSLAAIATILGYLAAGVALTANLATANVSTRLLLAAVLANAVPLTALAIQSRKLQRRPNPFLALALLHTYFVARFLALLIRDGRQR